MFLNDYECLQELQVDSYFYQDEISKILNHDNVDNVLPHLKNISNHLLKIIETINNIQQLSFPNRNTK